MASDGDQACIGGTVGPVGRHIAVAAYADFRSAEHRFSKGPVDTMDQAGNPWLRCIKREQNAPRRWRLNGGCRVSLVGNNQARCRSAGSALVSR